MRKLFKKSLACLLAAIFCVTLCVAAVPASAEAPTYSTNDVVAKAGETVNIDFTVSNFINVKGAMIKLTLPEVVASITDVNLNGADLAAYDAETGAGYYQVNGKEIKFLSLFGFAGELDAVATLTFNITAVIADDAAEGTYTYADPYFSVTEDGETLVDVAGTFGTFEIKNDITDASLTLPSMLYMGSVIGLYYGVPVSQYEGKYEDYYVEVTAEKYDASYNVYTAEPVKIYKSENKGQTGGFDLILYDKSAGYEMLLKLTSRVVYLNGGVEVAASAPTTTTVAEKIKGQIGGLNPANAQQLVAITLLVDMVNYGAAAEDFFANQYPNSQLAASTVRANAGFDAYQQYASADVSPANIENKTFPYAGDKESANILKMVQITSSNVIAYAPSAGSHDVSKLYVTVEYTDSYNQPQDITVRYSDFASVGYFTYDKVALYDAAKPVYCKLYEDGNDTALVEHTFSIASAAAANNQAIADDIYQAIVNLSASSHKYFFGN